MAVDGGCGMVVTQSPEQGRQGKPLRRSAGVGRPSRPVESADIAYPDRPAVVVQTMGSGEVYVTSPLDSSVKPYDEMIADVVEPPFKVPPPDVVGREILPVLSRRTMQDDFVDLTCAPETAVWNRGKRYGHTFGRLDDGVSGIVNYIGVLVFVTVDVSRDVCGNHSVKVLDCGTNPED